MTASRYRLILVVRNQPVTRDIMLESDNPVVDILNWLEDEYEFRANLRKVYLVRNDGVEEQIY